MPAASRPGSNPDLTQLFDKLERELPALMASAEPWRVTLNGQGQRIKVEVLQSEVVNMGGKEIRRINE